MNMTSNDKAKDLDRQLDAYTVAPASARLRAALMDAIPTAAPRPWAAVLLEAVGGWRIAAPALAMSLVLGVVVQLQGWLGAPATAVTVELDVLQLAMLDSGSWEVAND